MRRELLTVTVLAATLVAGAASAQPQGKYFYAGPLGGYTMFDTDMKAPNGRELKDMAHFGGVFGFQWLPWLGVEATGSFTPTQEEGASPLDVDWGRAGGNFTLVPWQLKWGGPYVLLGATGGRLRSSGGKSTNQLNAEYGLGVNYWVNDLVGIRVEGRDAMWIPREDKSSPKAHTLMATAGVVFAFGGTPSDADADGIPDNRDQCPGTPAGATVNAQGCTSDTDKDGVLDGLDQCPSTPTGATVDAKGCTSDSDGDGVLDGIDKCADSPRGAAVDLTGCPKDSDADGVSDGIDQCASTPAGATVDATGCPKDTDNDGVFDGIDKCPETSPGLRVDTGGCPIEVTERETELLDTGMIRLQDINFETGKATLLPESLPSLDIAGQVLSKWPDLRIEIGGHADSRGATDYNQRLSQSRVNTVLEYLIGKFPALKREQFTAVGYGESKPLVPNNSPLNMSKNRRVEFKVLNTEVLKREVERRKLLEK